jgi:transposase
MWTIENRGRYDRSKLRYPSDLTDAEWALVAPLIPRAKRGGNKRTVDVREIINGIMYILGTGCQWAEQPKVPRAAARGMAAEGALPTDLPPRSTVNSYFLRWQHDRTLDRLHHALYVQCRDNAGRDASPTAAIIDSQSVKSAEKGGIRTGTAMTRGSKSRARSATSSSIRRAC